MMHLFASASRDTQFPSLHAAISLILQIQRPDGSIPWFEDGIWDAWNHVECAMALEVAGEVDAADKAYEFLRTTQHPDGSWLGEYGNTAAIVDELFMSRETAGKFHDTNFIAYCATGIWHRYASRNDKSDLAKYWPMVREAINFVIDQQSDFGDVSWSSEAVSFGPDDSVKAGNASIRKSLECAVRIANVLAERKDAKKFRSAMRAIDHAFIHHNDRFDRAGSDRSSYAMDWYYPSMSGTLKGHKATVHLRKKWNHFVVSDLGCRCVSNEPWVTVAESAELVITLAGLGARDIAADLLLKQFNHRDEDGCFWMGYQFEENIFWPREKPSWTQAAVILAVETLRSGSPTASLLSQHF